MRLLVILLFSAYLLSACGHKGPLYLPNKADEGNPAISNEMQKK
ncbi:LPS translocon maturation chaperone LptM [Nitrosomonas sp.]|nr:lipoprotein [Nitrosomonas sp.]MBX3616968.1 lipoprotein [Nitrosomonas sp.]